MVITAAYWIGSIVMGPVTIFALKGGNEKAGTYFNLQWVGLVAFWAIMIIAWIVSYAIKPKTMTCEKWCKEVFFYGAYELALMVA